jgi:hypothetical protein
MLAGSGSYGSYEPPKTMNTETETETETETKFELVSPQTAQKILDVHSVIGKWLERVLIALVVIAALIVPAALIEYIRWEYVFIYVGYFAFALIWFYGYVWNQAQKLKPKPVRRSAAHRSHYTDY